MTTRLNRSLRALPLWMHFVILILVFIIIALASALYIHHQTYRDAERAAHKHANFAAHVAADDLSDQVASIQQTVLSLAATPHLASVFKNPSACTLSVTGGHVDIIHTTGETACSSLPLHGKRVYPSSGWFLQSTMRPTLAAPVRDPATGLWALAYAAPMPHRAGVVAGLFDLDSLAAALLAKYSGGEPFLFVITDGKHILSRSLDAEKFIGKPVLKRLSPPTGDYTARDRSGVVRFFAQTRVKRVGWHFYAGEQQAAAVAPGQALERRQFGILAFGLLLMLAATLTVYALMTKPIYAMSRAIRQDSRVPISGPRELGALAGDINAMLGRQEKERQAQKMEALGRLASGIAHDFNNLLLIISSGARTILRRNEVDTKSSESAHRIDRAAHRGQQLTNQLLAFARQRAITPVPTDANVVVREISGMLDRLLSKNITTSIDLADELPEVLIDDGQLAQVILNLAINASDAMPDGGHLAITTRVTIIDQDDLVPGPYVELAVADTGIGIDAETLNHVFDPFFTTKQEGTGLGLSTVHGIVTGAGGVMSVESEPGEGTTFTVRIPAASISESLLRDTGEHEVTT